MNIEPSPAVESFKNWCLDRINDSEEEIRKAQEYKKNGNIAIGEGMRELRKDAKISKQEIAEKMSFPPDIYYIENLENGRVDWHSGLVNEYLRNLAIIYIEKNKG